MLNRVASPDIPRKNKRFAAARRLSYNFRTMPGWRVPSSLVKPPRKPRDSHDRTKKLFEMMSNQTYIRPNMQSILKWGFADTPLLILGLLVYFCCF